LGWQKGATDGGTPIIDYTLSYSLDNGISYSVLKSGILTPSYTATNLITGQSYKFYVQARNILGNSPFSATATVLCAWVPFTPATPTTTVVGNQVVIAWNTPNPNGSPMLGY